MSSLIRRGILAPLVAVAAVGCNSFLSTDKAVNDPNNPSVATAEQLFLGVQVAQFAQQEGILAMFACAWTQQCTGTSNFLQSIEEYNTITEDLHSPAWSSVYEGGGLADIKAVEGALGPGPHRGIVRIYEALDIGTAADVWGNIPYREASSPSSHPTPHLDPQMQVYGDLQQLLDDAITDLASGGGSWAADLVFQGSTTAWTKIAHSMKARLYMHTAEVNGNADYTSARAEALLGIDTPAGSWVSVHGANPGEDNLWFQFYARSGFGQYIIAGKALADLMVARNDPRLPQYFGPATPGPGYGGQDPFGVRSPAGFSELTGTRNTATFAQPILTWEETQLIAAEAAFQLSGAAAAQPYVDAVRASVGLGVKPVTSLNDIMEEKYIALYQNIEVWNDYKRTCYPTLTAADPTFDNLVPGRVYYGTNEENVNPNVPSRSQQVIDGGVGFRNPNDPNHC
jgi:hypothetical protein